MKLYVCEVSELEEKKSNTFKITNLEVGIILYNSKTYAYENNCPHMGGPVCLGEVMGKIKTKLRDDRTTAGEYVSDNEINLICPWHGYEFDIFSGKKLGEPECQLHKFETSIEGDQVFVEVKLNEL